MTYFPLFNLLFSNWCPTHQSYSSVVCECSRQIILSTSALRRGSSIYFSERHFFFFLPLEVIMPLTSPPWSVTYDTMSGKQSLKTVRVWFSKADVGTRLHANSGTRSRVMLRVTFLPLIWATFTPNVVGVVMSRMYTWTMREAFADLFTAPDKNKLLSRRMCQTARETVTPL